MARYLNWGAPMIPVARRARSLDRCVVTAAGARWRGQQLGVSRVRTGSDARLAFLAGGMRAGPIEPVRARPGPVLARSESDVRLDASRRPRGRALRIWGSLAFVAPAIVFVTVFLFWPIVRSVWGSFEVRHGMGLGNYRAVLTSGQLVDNLIVTMLITVAGVIGALAVASVLALLLNSEKVYGQRAARALVVIPWAVPAVVVGLLWSAAFSPTSGIVDYVAHSLGVMGSPWQWLTNPHKALAALIIVRIWQYFPIGTVFISAALQAVDTVLYEVASIDGASSAQRFRYVTLPGIRPTVTLVGLLFTAWIFRGFALIYLLTNGGPGTSTETLVLGVYNNAFVNFNFGTANALGVVTMVLAGALSMLVLWGSRVGSSSDGRSPRQARWRGGPRLSVGRKHRIGEEQLGGSV